MRVSAALGPHQGILGTIRASSGLSGLIRPQWFVVAHIGPAFGSAVVVLRVVGMYTFAAYCLGKRFRGSTTTPKP